MNLKSIAEQTVHSLGAAQLLRVKNGARARILMYHRFHGNPEASLTAQCEHIRRHYHPITLDDIADAARDSRPLPRNAIAITIDDGYRDFQLAFPIFQSFDLKPTLYVVSGFAAGDLWLWPDQLLYLLENSPYPEARVPIHGVSIQVDLSNPTSAFEILCRKMIAMQNPERLKLLSSLPAILDVELPKSPPDRFAPLSWEDLRALASQGLDIGAHTVQHPILSKLPTEAELRHEIAGSKAQIEAATGAAVKHFCYPNGKLADVNEPAVAIAAGAGFRTAVLAEPGLVHPPFLLHRLKRVGVDPDLPPLYFERCVAGYRL